MGPVIIALVSSLVLSLNNATQIPGGVMRYGILSLIVLFIGGGLLFNYVRKLPDVKRQ
jgi:hypothetical protein